MTGARSSSSRRSSTRQKPSSWKRSSCVWASAVIGVARSRPAVGIVGGLDGPEAFRHLEQGRVELDEGVLDGGVVPVAGVAPGRGRKGGSPVLQALLHVEAEVAPPVRREPLRVLHGG